MAQWVENLCAVEETQVMQLQSLGQGDTLEEEMATHSGILAMAQNRRSHGNDSCDAAPQVPAVR